MAREGPLQITKITGEYVEVRAERYYRGKTGGYWREETAILQILDKHGNEVRASWDKEWKESAPGIETRREDEGTVTRVGGAAKYETHWDKRVRIYPRACPVRLKFLHSSEYIDYESAEFSSGYSTVYWVRYEV